MAKHKKSDFINVGKFYMLKKSNGKTYTREEMEKMTNEVEIVEKTTPIKKRNNKEK